MVRIAFSCISSLLIGAGYLHASPWLWLSGIKLFNDASPRWVRSLIQVALIAYYYFAIYQDALFTVYPKFAYESVLVSAVILFGLWWIWFLIFDHVRHSVIQTFIWFVLSESIWQWLDIALYRTTPMLAQTPFDVLVYYLGGGAIYVFYVLAVSRSLMACALSISLLSLIGYTPLSTHFYPVNILAEGDVYTGQENTIYHHLDDHQYSVYQGTSSFRGYAKKKHPVPFAESYYQKGIGSRLICDQKCYLVLICYDALFDDWIEEYDQADAIIVVSHLIQFEDTPLYQYFRQQIKYLHLRSQKPLIYRDSLYSENLGIE
jgi:hypothetical protein